MLKRLFLMAVVIVLAASLAAAGSLKLINKVAPVYPPDAKAAGIEGKVILSATINKDGEITKLEVVEGPPELRAAAQTAVQQWRYEAPGTEVVTSITINFTLAKDKPPEEKK